MFLYSECKYNKYRPKTPLFAKVFYHFIAFFLFLVFKWRHLYYTGHYPSPLFIKSSTTTTNTLPLDKTSNRRDILHVCPLASYLLPLASYLLLLASCVSSVSPPFPKEGEGWFVIG